MDTTEAETLPSRGSQSKLSAAIFFVLLAALLFRVVTGVMDRPKDGAAGGPSHAEAPPLIRWVPLERAESVSRETGKPILYDFTAEWCPPCRLLDREGWGDREVAAFLNDGFVPVRVLDRVREEGKNPPRVDELQRRHGVEAFPALIVAGRDGKAVGREDGWGGKDNLRRFLEESKAKAAEAPAGASIP